MSVSENVKQSIYNLVRTGMSIERAYILVELDDEDVAVLRADERFQRKVKFYVVDQERELLEGLDTVIKGNIKRGISTEVRWKLERINPTQWAVKQGTAPPSDEPLPDIIVTAAPALSDSAEEESV